MTPPFHLAIPVHDIAAARAFYGGVLECPEGRSSDHWVDFDLYGHQLVVHLRESMTVEESSAGVDTKSVPIPHFGVVLSMDDWHALADRMRERDTEFVIEPYVRFVGEPGEQATMFFRDPSGNALEFKAFADAGQLFAR